MYFHLTKRSGNAKTGPIPVSTTSAGSCPPTCPFNGSGCYAQGGHVAMHWRRVTAGDRGGSLDAFLAALASVLRRTGQLWRHNQAGDLPGNGTKIAASALERIVETNRTHGGRGFTYTHYRILGGTPTERANLRAVKAANDGGFTINASCESMVDADRAMDEGVPATVVTPGPVARGTRTPGGRPVLQCPATSDKGEAAGVTCASCGLCARSDRPYAIAFPVHGQSRARAAEALQDGDTDAL